MHLTNFKVKINFNSDIVCIIFFALLMKTKDPKNIYLLWISQTLMLDVVNNINSNHNPHPHL